MKHLYTVTLVAVLSGFNFAQAADTDTDTVAKATECTQPAGFRGSADRDPTEGPYDFLDKFNP